MKKYRNFIIFILLTILLYGYCFLLVEQKNADAIKSVYKSNVEKQSIAYIHQFKTTLNHNKIFFDWEMDVDTSDIKSIQLYSNDTMIADVTHQDEYSLSVFSPYVQTGDNYFKLVVSLNNGKKYDKNAFLYIKEVFNFNVEVHNENNIVYYDVDYYYDTKKPVKLPSVEYSLKSNTPTKFKLIDQQAVNLENNMVHMKLRYKMELDTKEREPIEVISTIWKFNEYNLDFKNEYTTQ